MTSLVVTATHSYRATRAFDTPADAFESGLVAFLERVCRRIAGVGVVLVDTWAAKQLGLPYSELPRDGGGKSHPAALVARAAGWEVDEVHRWTRFRKGGREVHIGLLAFIDPEYCPILTAGPGGVGGAAAADALDAWQELSGLPYWGDPGDAVSHLLMSLSRATMNGQPVIPSWRPRNTHEKVAGLYARTFHRAGFDRSADQPGRFLVGYDATRAYLSAMTVVEVAPLPLRPTGKRSFDPTAAGWWLCHLDPWTIPRLPAPWGHYPDGDDRASLVWLTTPDLVLLSQLAEQGRYGGFSIVDSFTSRAHRDVMRPAGERLRDMWDKAAGLFEDDRDAVRATIQAGYQAMHSKWRSTKGNGDICRPDWSAALVATARTNLWRRIDRAAGTKAKPGRLPAFVDGIDTVYYATDHPDDPPAGIVTERFPLNVGGDTDRLGTFRRKYIIDREQEGTRATS
jgi:hypothetical protein